MDKVSILVCDPIAKEGIEMLREAGFDLDLDPNLNHDELVKRVSEYNALIVRSRTKINREVFEAAKNLKVVARAGVGLDNIDTEEAKDRGIEIVNSPEAPSNSVAELVAGFILCLARSIPKADRYMKKGEWIKQQLTGFEVEGKTIGIIGFGRIGYALAKKLSGMGMKIIAFDVALEIVKKYMDEAGVESVSMDEILKKSDFITIHVPLLPTTHHLISTEQLDKMKKGSYIINTSRGGVVDEEALKIALDSGHIAGAALDVYEEEPPKDLSLINREDVICTPHIGSVTEEAQIANSTIVAEKLIKLFS